MKKYSESIILKTSLAIFAMLFGSANLIFPIKLGAISGDHTWLGLIGFMLSGILIPIFGLIGMVFFDGDYRSFFYRMGKVPGDILIFLCMLIIGPILAIPRIISLTYATLAPFLGQYINLATFSILFVSMTFLLAYKESSVINLIGKVLSPLKLLSLIAIFVIGYIGHEAAPISNISNSLIFHDGLLYGYNTLDLLGAIFFAYITINALYTTEDKSKETGSKKIAKIMLYSSVIAGVLLATVYGALAYLGAWYGSEFASQDLSEVFIKTILKIVGEKGALVLGITVFIACLTTIIALSSVASSYLKNDVLDKKLSLNIPYTACLIGTLGLAAFMAQFKLDPLIRYSEPVIKIIYPVLIALTFCNLAYKLWGFKPVKAPVLITLVTSIFYTILQYI